MLFPLGAAQRRPARKYCCLPSQVVFILRFVDSISRSLCHKLVAHLTQPFDFGFHDVAGLEESVGALADAAASSATEDVARIERENMRGIFDLLLGRVDK